MREIKMRGYAVEEMVNDQWMYGTGIHKTVFTDEYAKNTGIKEEWFIFTESGWVQVEPKSTGQYTDLKDKNGMEIYEGDIIKLRERTYHEVVYARQGFWLSKRVPLWALSAEIEVIGNKYEHPHLLEGDSN